MEAIYNHQLKPRKNNPDGLEGLSVSEYMKFTAKRLGLNPKKVSGFITAADMKDVAILNKKFRDIEVTAIVTGGINKNGGRAGDPASYYESNGNFKLNIGTINTIIIINSCLHESTLLRAVMTDVEAKTIALQELMASSKYSNGIATGSGTDKISVISNMESKNNLADAGKHSKLGELIGKCVIDATKDALAKHTNLTPETQCNMLIRLNRFGIGEKTYWKIVSSKLGINQKKEYINYLHDFSKNPQVVAMISSILHIIDEIQWSLVPEPAGKKVAISIMRNLPKNLEIKKYSFEGTLLNDNNTILENWIKISSWCVFEIFKLKNR